LHDILVATNIYPGNLAWLCIREELSVIIDAFTAVGIVTALALVVSIVWAGGCCRGQ
jgi:hypothetical protein